jgi:hypothetical protein
VIHEYREEEGIITPYYSGMVLYTPPLLNLLNVS